MLDPQTVQLIVMAVALVLAVVLIFALLYGLILLSRIRKQAVGINQRLDELLGKVNETPGSSRETGMSL